MTTEDMIRELINVAEKYKDKPVYTGDVNISIMCTDVARRLTELNKENESLRDENKFLKEMIKFYKGES